MPVQKTNVTIGEHEYEIEHLSGHAARRAFHLVFRMLGDSLIVLVATGDPMRVLDAMKGASVDDVDQLVALVAPKTKLLLRAQFANGAAAPVPQPLDWDRHFVGPAALHQFRMLFEHIKWNFGETFLGAAASSSSSPSASPEPTGSSPSPSASPGQSTGGSGASSKEASAP